MNPKLLGRNKWFDILNHTFLFIVAFLCIAPVIHVWALSLSASGEAASGSVYLWPVKLNFNSYEYILKNNEFFDSLLVTFKRATLGTLISLSLVVLTAYPLSKENQVFRFRTLYAWYFVFTILFHGSFIPWYLVIHWTGIMDTIWALVLPGAVQVFNVILLLNFFRNLPKELEESAFMDGAGHLTTLIRIYLPLSLPALATLMLLTIVWHWNTWFDGLVLMNVPQNYPLSTYLQTIIVQGDFSYLNSKDVERMAEMSDRTVKASQIFLGALPIILIYPFLQKYFIKGLVMGSVKE
jgi:putative aldouronate transport system permease protein